ncbi:hypothetical protein BsWGS_26320 [Bradybaena similaris]
MKFLCIFASICLAVSSLSFANPNSRSAQPLTVECGRWYGSFDVVNPRVTGPRTIITSSHYNEGGGYGNNEKCAIQFRAEDQPLNLRFRFPAFAVENSISCSYDAFCLNGFAFCGQTLAGRTVSYTVPANSTFTVTFRSDSSIPDEGIYAVVDAEPAQSPLSGDDYQDYCLNQYEEPSPAPFDDSDFSDYSTPATEPVYDYLISTEGPIYDYLISTEGPIYDYLISTEGPTYDYGETSEDNYNY